MDRRAAPKVVCNAVFARGTGLGNRLFPWARCRIFSLQHQVPMLRPQWEQFRLGPFLRGGVSLQNYRSQILLWGLFNKATATEVFLKKMCASYEAVPEPGDVFDATQYKKGTVIEFKGDGSHFRDLEVHRRFIYQELLAVTRPQWLRLIDSFSEVPIVLNVRRGKDFPDLDSSSAGPRRTPLDWFARALNIVREAAGHNAKAVIISDSTERDLRPLLDQKNVFFVRPGCAISDLLITAKARILLASGGSSFSAWASFLGGMPTISMRGHSLTWFKLDSRPDRYVGAFDPDSPSPVFLEQAARILKG